MPAYAACAAVLLFVLIGLIDASRGRRSAQSIGTLGLLLAAFVAGHSVWRVSFQPELAALPSVALGVLSVVAVVLGLVADYVNEQRTKAVGALIALVVLAWALPGASAGPLSLGAVLFMAALALLAGSVGGSVANRLLRALRSSRDDDDDEHTSSAP